MAAACFVLQSMWVNKRCTNAETYTVTGATTGNGKKRRSTGVAFCLMLHHSLKYKN
jgi:hypothetical protein